MRKTNFSDILSPTELAGSESICSSIQVIGKISQKCTRCGLCRSTCDFLKKYGLPGDIASGFQKDPSTCHKLAFSCSLCGLCAALCPLDLEPNRMFLGLRRRACENGRKESGRHRRLLKYEEIGISERYAWRSLPENCTSVFFPGCTLPGTRPKRTLQLYFLLQNRDPSLGLILDCCCKPSHDLGRQQLFENRFSSLNRKLTATGIEKIITACPNCYKVFSQYGKEVEVTTVYEHLATKGFVAKGRIDGIVTLHDPCVTRDKSGIHDAVRSLIHAHGLTIQEMRHTREKTLCCGNGGAVDKHLAKGWTNSRKEEADGRPILTYCAGCADRLGRSTPTFHLIDLLFEPEKTINGKVRVFRTPFTYLNRLWIKRTLERKNNYTPFLLPGEQQ